MEKKLLITISGEGFTDYDIMRAIMSISGVASVRVDAAQQSAGAEVAVCTCSTKLTRHTLQIDKACPVHGE